MSAPTKTNECVLIGEEALLVECGRELLDRGFSITAVVSDNDQVSEWSKSIEAPVISPSHGIANQLETISYDWLFSIANLRMLAGDVWRRARRGAVNFHDGPLPAYAGLNTPAWAILAGEAQHGVTWHALADGADTGDIYVQRLVEISPDETTLTLNTKCFEAGIESFSELLDMIQAGGLEGRPQVFDKRSYFARDDRPEAAATLDFARTSDDIIRLVRALDFGPKYANPLCAAKISTQTGAYNVASVAPTEGSATAGTVLAVASETCDVATADGAVRLTGFTDANGQAVAPAKIVREGEVLKRADNLDAVTSFLKAVVPHEAFFRKELAGFRDVELYGVKPAEPGAADGTSVVVDEVKAGDGNGLTGEAGVAAVLAALLRVAGEEQFGVALVDDALVQAGRDMAGYGGHMLPLNVAASEDRTVAEFAAEMVERVSELRSKRGYPGDLIVRTPGLKAPDVSVGIRLTEDPGAAGLVDGTALTFVVPVQAGSLRVIANQARVDEANAAVLAGSLRTVLTAFNQDTSRTIAELPVMSAEDQAVVLHERNHTERDYDRTALVHDLIAEQVAKTPDATAVVCLDRSLTYRQLDEQSNAVARALLAQGAGPDVMIGIYMQRSVDLVVGVLGILKAGAAYVPLDPTYPADRVALMIEDSGLNVVLSQREIAGSIPSTGPQVMLVEDVVGGDSSPLPAGSQTTPDNLAYVIYTSGSTGRPKGVMVEHRNLVNFFVAMDERIPVAQDAQPVWLAVTSLSFDISVLELVWTLTRGFKVVVHVDDKRGDAAPAPRTRVHVEGGMGFGLFYWGHDDKASPNKYHLLLDGARFADENGFNAVWTPERHFHAFGGSYPNPSVTGAAVAGCTRNLEIRAGSCVLPLHHPARVAEEWAVIDNISHGRVGLAFASGWMPEDFLLRPENAPPNNKTAMLRDIDIVRRLWRGEDVAFKAPNGKMVNVVTQPRPVQRELPVWVTTAGNPETYRDAARAGANVLTHLLGQSVEEVADKIRIYRETLEESGRNPADYTVTLMLHTLIGTDREVVREQAREPMKSYLRSAAALIKEYAWAFPAFKKPQGVSNPTDIDLQSLEDEEMEAILDFAFLRYFDDSGFFGTVEDGIARAQQLKDIGVDEIACLIDFGISHESALEGLKPLAQVVAAVNPPSDVEVAAPVEQDYGLAALIERHRVTHLQCTPSMATMLMLNDDDKRALHGVRHLFLGGEALQASLLRELRDASPATIDNMYGPTETTIWSSTGPAGDTDTTVPLGTPLANTQLYILDDRLRPVPAGLPGELFIGGDGVTRGYHNREELTNERFLANPFVSGGRMYRTGDLVRIGPEGEIQFIGRTDHQVKVRGYRIELGEIEARLGLHPGVAEAVVVAREDEANDVRIVAYNRYTDAPVAAEELAEHVRAALPEFMVPVHFVAMDKFPLTPNAKVDRKALPRPQDAQREAAAIEFIVPDNEVQQRIADAFKRVLRVERVGALDSFFALGGHSLLAVQVHRDLKKNVAPQLSITDIYRFPTVAALAAHVQGGDEADSQLGRVAERAAMRRRAAGGRRAFAARGGQ